MARQPSLPIMPVKSFKRLTKSLTFYYGFAKGTGRSRQRKAILAERDLPYLNIERFGRGCGAYGDIACFILPVVTAASSADAMIDMATVCAGPRGHPSSTVRSISALVNGSFSKSMEALVAVACRHPYHGIARAKERVCVRG